MAKFCNSLNNIKKVEVIEARHLKNINIIHGVGVLLNYWRNFVEIPITELGEVEMVSSIENKSRLITTKLTFHTSTHFDVDNRQLCFRVTTINGSQWLIGTDVHPFAVVNTTDRYPSNVTDKSGCTVVAEYKNTHGMLAILDKYR